AAVCAQAPTRNNALGLSSRLQTMTSTTVPKGTSPSHGTNALTASASPSRSRYSVMTGNEPTICVSNRVAASMPRALLGPTMVTRIAKGATTPSNCHDQPARDGAECEYLVISPLDIRHSRPGGGP